MPYFLFTGVFSVSSSINICCCIDPTSSRGSIKIRHIIFDLIWWIKELVVDMTSQLGLDSAVFLRYVSAWMRSWLPWALWGRRMHRCRSQRIIPSLCTLWVDRPWPSSARATQVSLLLSCSSPRLFVSFMLDNLIWNARFMGAREFKLK